VADNVELDAGSGGAVVSTEEITTLNGSGSQPAQHVQRMLLAFRTGDGAAADLPGDTTNGLDVDVTRSALPTGASTSANQTTIIGHLDGVEGLLTTIDADTGNIATNSATIAGAVSGSEMQVDVVTSALPTGAATAANQTTMIGHLDGVEGLLTTIDADTGTLAGAVSGTEVQVDVVAALPAGNNNIGDVDVASIAAGTNSIGNVGVIPRTSGGLTIFRSLDLDETEEEIKATAGQLFGWYIYNDGAADVSVKLYNATAANVTVGTTTPVMTLTIPAGAAANVLNPMGIAFGTAITAAAVTEIADNGTTAPAANQVVANFFYS
jgi:hypothetical protein